ncbi:MAG: ATP-grasp fold amidoligase family protein [Clostridia bacterium]
MTIRRILAHNKVYIALSHTYYRCLTRISPTWNSKRRWKKIFGFPLRLDAPIWWSEKLMWLKLNCYQNNALVRTCANKYRVRAYVEQCGCGELLIDCIGLWERAQDIPWDELPKKFVLKSTMGCGNHVFCSDRAELDRHTAMETLNAVLQDRYYLDYAELQYAPGKDMHPQIIGERMIEMENGRMLSDYKLFCFHGEPKFILYCYDRSDAGHANYMFYDEDWSLHPEYHPCDAMDHPPEKPDCIEKMIAYARRLSAPFPFVRVDFYEERGQVRFGELTFTPSACLDVEMTELGQITLGKLLDLNGIDIIR